MSDTATYTKLRDGNWGIRVIGSKPVIGQVVNVTKKSGDNKTEIVSAVLWSGNDTHLCSVERRGGSPRSTGRRTRGTWTGCSCGSVEEYERKNDCASCRHDRD